MKRKIMTVGLIFMFMLSLDIVLAGQGESSQTSSGNSQAADRGSDIGQQVRQSTQGEPDQDQSQIREQTRDQERKQVMEQQETHTQEQVQEMNQERLYEADDGKRIQWEHNYTKRMRKHEDKGKEAGMLRYLERICARNGIEDPEEIKGFVKWAFDEKPWRE